jgi:coenzyme F420-reducing hydrogenase alpha subunit
MKRRTIKVDYLARVEGEGAMTVKIKDDVVEEVQFRIFEPPRFFEGFLQGRDFTEAPDITARICGICPVAYQMSAVQAMEDALGVHVEGPLRDLRRLLYCGEWIESHILHIFMLHAPDFLGYQSVVHMAQDHPDLVKSGLFMKKVGNDLVTAVGGREIHPINVKVGGFYRCPERHELEPLLPRLAEAEGRALDAVRWATTLDFPDYERDYELVSLQHPDEYPMNEGRVVSTGGIDIPVREYGNVFTELHVPHSTSLHSHIRGRGPYLVGPMARFAHNFDRLPDDLKALCDEHGLGPDCRNPFKSLLIRGIETLVAIREARRIISDYTPPAEPAVACVPQAGVGHGATEAPRGLLYHRYALAADGSIEHAKIVPPTSQNQPSIEADLRGVVERFVDLPDDELTWRCEQTIRNYDPCISCSTHFLKLEVVRS